jgi:type IV secretion system protein TrbB
MTCRPRQRATQTGSAVVTTLAFRSESYARGARMLRTALGPAIAGFLDDACVVEVMLNPDGRLWIDRLTGGLEDTGARLSPADGERIVRLVAHHVGVEVHAQAPRVSAELPETGERFEGLLPPVVAAPSFAIRKPAVAVFTLGDYVATRIMTEAQAEVLRAAVHERRNILVAGGTSTGKTTLVNALLAEVALTGDRVVLIEDTRELQCTAPNMVALRTKDGAASLTDLVRSALRLRPDRIPIGEVRGGEALDLINAWGTGHPGGVGTLHAGSALGALRRLEQLVQEAVITVPRALIAETIDLVAVLSGRGSARRLSELARVEGLSPDSDYRLTPATLLAKGDLA